MLDGFKDSQKIAYQILKNEIQNDCISHAYLIETNDFCDSNDFIISFSKTLLCPYNYFNNEKCVNCTQCQNIDKGVFSELKIIYPDGLWIKKDQTDTLQKDYLTKSILSDKRVYIIKDADKLNTSSANSLLKFIEEPADGIIAILVTSNTYNVISTIRSRCQIISLKRTKVDEQKQFIDRLELTDEEYVNMKEGLIKFAVSIEKKKYDTILDVNNIFDDNLTRENYINLLDMLIFYYKDIINKKMNRNLNFYNDGDVNTVFDDLTINNILNKINVTKKIKNDIIANGNLNLLIDRLIIELSGGIV